ncbi:MAG: hypothetical protein GX417_07765 [Clostridiales bacterium]|nr:hypothetical protein [Clostridiales bacterium]
MRNERRIAFSNLTVDQTDRLIDSFEALPLGGAVNRRIRNSVLKAVAPRRARRSRLIRTLVPLAASLLMLVMFFVAFPKAAQAVSDFIGRVFTPGRYMSEDPAARTPVPSIDEAIAAAAPKDGDYTITLMPDLPDPQQYVDFRAENGYAPFSEENWGWLREIRPEIAEVLYDGNQLIWNTNLYTANEHVREFMDGFGDNAGSKLSVDALMDDVTYTVEGDPTVYPLQVSGHGITPIQDETVLAGADHVVLYSDFDIDPTQPLPDGILTITQNIRICENDAMNYGATVAILTHTFTFDTTKGNTQSAELQEGDIPLLGETYLTVDNMIFAEDGSITSWTISTQKVSLNGVVLHAEYEYLPTGISVVLTLASAPSNWTDNMVNALLRSSNRSIQNTYHKIGNVADMYINGVFVSEAPRPDSWGIGEQRYTLPIYPDQYETTQSVVLKLIHVYNEMLNGTNQIAGEVYTVTNGQSTDKAQTNFSPLVEITVPIPKS